MGTVGKESHTDKASQPAGLGLAYSILESTALDIQCDMEQAGSERCSA